MIRPSNSVRIRTNDIVERVAKAIFEAAPFNIGGFDTASALDKRIAIEQAHAALKAIRSAGDPEYEAEIAEVIRRIRSGTPDRPPSEPRRQARPSAIAATAAMVVAASAGLILLWVASSG